MVTLKPSIYDLNLEALRGAVTSCGEQPYRARQVARWLYQRNARTADDMRNVPKTLRASLAERFVWGRLSLDAQRRAEDDSSVKCAFRLPDQEIIESVLIPSERRVTACISTQVGCKFACVFCASGMNGFVGNLSAGDMLEQVLWLNRLAAPRRVTHLVFMGIGEPLDNYDALATAIDVLTAPEGLGMSPRRLTVSTCGVAPKIERLAEDGIHVNLSLSLHGVTDELRTQLMPVNRAYPLERVMRACRTFRRLTKGDLTFEYILLGGRNDQPSDAQTLALLARSLSAKVNLIPYNPVEGLAFQTPTEAQAESFQQRLMAEGVVATIRWSRGRAVDAACGQLRIVRRREHSGPDRRSHDG